MKNLLALTLLLLLTQPAFTKILAGHIDPATKKVHLILEIANYCNGPEFVIDASYCQRRIDGPCFFSLQQTRQNKMACEPGTTGVIYRVLDAPEAMLDESLTIVLGFHGASFRLRDGAFWRK